MRLLQTISAMFFLGLSACFGSVGNSALPEPAVHRSEAIACDNVRDSPMVSMSTEEGGCTSHADCTDGANGRCLPNRLLNLCSYDGCFDDSECGGPCVCGMATGANFCTSGGCQVDADCGPGGWCSPTYGGCGLFGGVVAFECHTASDECTDDSDCSDLANGYCTFSAEVGHWICGNAQCAG